MGNAGMEIKWFIPTLKQVQTKQTTKGAENKAAIVVAKGE